MRIRVVAGEFGGRFLVTPNTSSTHPMSERARAAIFNSLGKLTAESKVLDAFAGSGALGIEALSRGADSVVFIEKNRIASKVIKENCESLALSSEKCIVINTTVLNWLKTSSPEEYDLIFADPPYSNEQLSTISMLMGLLKIGGYMVLSHTGRGGVPVKTGIVVVDNRSYGNAYITFYRREA